MAHTSRLGTPWSVPGWLTPGLPVGAEGLTRPVPGKCQASDSARGSLALADKALGAVTLADAERFKLTVSDWPLA